MFDVQLTYDEEKRVRSDQKEKARTVRNSYSLRPHRHRRLVVLAPPHFLFFTLIHLSPYFLDGQDILLLFCVIYFIRFVHDWTIYTDPKIENVL